MSHFLRVILILGCIVLSPFKSLYAEERAESSLGSHSEEQELKGDCYASLFDCDQLVLLGDMLVEGQGMEFDLVPGRHPNIVVGDQSGQPSHVTLKNLEIRGLGLRSISVTKGSECCLGEGVIVHIDGQGEFDLSSIKLGAGLCLVGSSTAGENVVRIYVNPTDSCMIGQILSKVSLVNISRTEIVAQEQSGSLPTSLELRDLERPTTAFQIASAKYNKPIAPSTPQAPSVVVLTGGPGDAEKASKVKLGVHTQRQRRPRSAGRR